MDTKRKCLFAEMTGKNKWISRGLSRKHGQHQCESCPTGSIHYFYVAIDAAHLLYLPPGSLHYFPVTGLYGVTSILALCGPHSKSLFVRSKGNAED